jgi:hypothetical protein
MKKPVKVKKVAKKTVKKAAVKPRTLKSLVINRERWGVADQGGSLRRPSTKLQCCLGFAVRACGIGPSTINNMAMPAEIAGRKALKLPTWLRDSAVTNQLAGINDDGRISFKDREKRIAGRFAKVGVKVNFTGKYPKKHYGDVTV